MSESDAKKFIVFLFLIVIAMVLVVVYAFKSESDIKDMQEAYYNQCISEGVITDFECRSMAI